jgi:hypothetical protein
VVAARKTMIVLGDEFGPIGESEGSDYLTLIPELRRSVFVSVGVESNGVPPRVLHAGGGPAEFLSILHDQLARREIVAQRDFPEPTPDPACRFEVKGFDPFREREVQTWLTVANGEIVDHERVLDVKHGVVYRTWRQQLGSGQTVRIRTARFASLADRQLLAVRAEATPENFGGRLVWEGAVGVTHTGGPTKETEFEALEEPGVIARTTGRNGGGHVLTVTTRPAPGSPVVRHIFALASSRHMYNASAQRESSKQKRSFRHFDAGSRGEGSPQHGQMRVTKQPCGSAGGPSD